MKIRWEQTIYKGKETNELKKERETKWTNIKYKETRKKKKEKKNNFSLSLIKIIS